MFVQFVAESLLLRFSELLWDFNTFVGFLGV